MKSLLNLWVNGRPREDAVAENALLVDYLRVLDVEEHPRVAQQALAQRAEHQVVARRGRHDAERRVDGEQQLAVELPREAFGLRQQPRKNPLLGPQQPLAERRQARRPTLTAADQRLAEHVSCRFSSPHKWRYDSPSSRAAVAIEPCAWTASSIASSGLRSGSPRAGHASLVPATK